MSSISIPSEKAAPRILSPSVPAGYSAPCLAEPAPLQLPAPSFPPQNPEPLLPLPPAYSSTRAPKGIFHVPQIPRVHRTLAKSRGRPPLAWMAGHGDGFMSGFEPASLCALRSSVGGLNGSWSRGGGSRAGGSSSGGSSSGRSSSVCYSGGSGVGDLDGFNTEGRGFGAKGGASQPDLSRCSRACRAGHAVEWALRGRGHVDTCCSGFGSLRKTEAAPAQGASSVAEHMPDDLMSILTSSSSSLGSFIPPPPVHQVDPVPAAPQEHAQDGAVNGTINAGAVGADAVVVNDDDVMEAVGVNDMMNIAVIGDVVADAGEVPNEPAAAPQVAFGPECVASIEQEGDAAAAAEGNGEGGAGAAADGADASESDAESEGSDDIPWVGNEPVPEPLPGNGEDEDDALCPEAGFVCEHYKRRCKIIAPCCGKLYECRRCHDAKEDHVMDRTAIKRVKCTACELEQDIGPSCIGCNLRFAKWYCEKCNLFDDDRTKAIYHCDACGVCRLGQGLGIDNYHCDRCGTCIPLHAKDSHTCMEDALDRDCPVCAQNMAHSVERVVLMRCGHAIHADCFRECTRHRYTCPICCKSLTLEMESFYNDIRAFLAKQPIPTERRQKFSLVFCNDCEVKTLALFHNQYHECQKCNGFNTAVHSYVPLLPARRPP